MGVVKGRGNVAASRKNMNVASTDPTAQAATAVPPQGNLRAGNNAVNWGGQQIRSVAYEVL